MKPSDVHPSHDVREEGTLVSDPVCQKCRGSVHDSPSRLLIECLGAPPTIKAGALLLAKNEELCWRLTESNPPLRWYGCSRRFYNRDGPEAARVIRELEAENAALKAEMVRRDDNETRNCLNWGPCSRHDGRIADAAIKGGGDVH